MPIDFKALESAEILSAIASIKTKQEEFKTENGRFWQGAKTFSSVPKYDKAQIPDKTKKIISEVKDWSDFGATMPKDASIGFEVHEYNGPQGKGFSIILATNDGTDDYKKVIHFGPEEGRGSDWSLVPKK